MYLQDLIGKRITNLFCLYRQEEGLNFADCRIELDNQICVGFPLALGETVETLGQEVWIQEEGSPVDSLFWYLTDFEILKEANAGLTTPTPRESPWLIKLLLPVRRYLLIKFYQQRYRESRQKHAENRFAKLLGMRITNILYHEYFDTLIIELENGMFLAERSAAPHGIGVGFECYASLEDHRASRSGPFVRLISPSDTN